MARPPRVVDRFDDVVDRVPLLSNRTTFLVLLISFAALVARLVFLGTRVAHFDEGRVAYWALHFLETGEFHYRFIVHGPFVQHVNAGIFGLFGANDFTMRLVVAIIGAVLPLAILLFREHLRDDELVAGALFLAFNPVLLYYSRFFRSSIPVAAFALVAFGLFVRFSDTRQFRYLHAGVVFVALAFTAKENAAVYVLVWIGAGALLLDHTLFRPRNAATGVGWARGWWERNVITRDWREVGPRYLGHLVLTIGLFLGVTIYFYAPRAPTAEGIGLWNAFGSGEFMPLLDATWRRIEVGFEYWFGGGIESGNRYSTLADRWVDFFSDFVTVLLNYALPLIGFAVVGFITERYATYTPRNLVMFASYWGFVSILGYPLGADIKAAWVTVNALVPLAIPGAVALAALYRIARESIRDHDLVSVVLVALILLVTVGLVAGVTLTSVYTNTTSADNRLVQYAQPGQEIRGTLTDMHQLAHENDGLDIVFYGDMFVSEGGRIDPGCTNIRETLPLEWYVAKADANATCATSEADLDQVLESESPPIIISTVSQSPDVRDSVPSYTERVRRLRTTGGQAVFFLDLDTVNTTVS